MQKTLKESFIRARIPSEHAEHTSCASEGKFRTRFFRPSKFLTRALLDLAGCAQGSCFATLETSTKREAMCQLCWSINSEDREYEAFSARSVLVRTEIGPDMQKDELFSRPYCRVAER